MYAQFDWGDDDIGADVVRQTVAQALSERDVRDAMCIHWKEKVEKYKELYPDKEDYIIAMLINEANEHFDVDAYNRMTEHLANLGAEYDSLKNAFLEKRAEIKEVLKSLYGEDDGVASLHSQRC